MKRKPLSDADRAGIMALKGKLHAAVLAERYGCSRHIVHSVWAGRKAGSLGRPVERLTDAKREQIIALRAERRMLADIAIITGFSQCTVSLVLRGARDEGDNRAAVQQSAAPSGAHREGRAPLPGTTPALAPNSMEASLIMRGVRPEVAAATARAWRDRHAKNHTGGART